MCSPVGVISAVASLAGAASNYKAQQKAAAATERATAQAREAAAQQASMAEKEMNKASNRKPNVQGMMQSNREIGGMGIGSTMLTGPGGVDPSALMLGKNTLLGA